MLPLVCCFTLAVSSPQCPTPAENRILSEVRSSFPLSVANAMGVSADGRYIYAGEGGSVAILDTSLPNNAGFGMAAPRVPVSRFGARPAKILVDPGPGSGTDDDVLIVCAGRSGLWVMDAHPTGPTYRAAVVDDSGNGVVSTQQSRRFCNDAVIFSVDGTEYVAAIFAKRNRSRLRIYDLASVRGVLAASTAGQWAGGEIAALHQVQVTGRSGMLTQTDPATSSHNESLTVGLDVDQVSASEAVLYMALWHQGLARVRVDSDGAGGLDVSGVQFGPVFGTGSYYHMQSEPAERREWFSNFVLHEGAEIYRQEPPVFTDVAVQSFCGHYLYTTVDTLGWVRFDLDGAWEDSMPIDHHEGEPYPFAPTPHPFGEIQLALDDDFTYPKQVRVVPIDGERSLLAVNATGITMVQPVGYRTEGSVFDHGAATFNGIPARYFLEQAILRGQKATFLYEVDCDGTIGDPTVVSDDAGQTQPVPAADLSPLSPVRSNPSGAKDIALLPGPGQGEAMLFVHNKDRTSKYRVTLGATTTVTEEGARILSHRGGYESLAIGYSPLNPDLLMLGTNDGGFPAPGILATCGSDIVRFFDPDSAGVDGRMTNGNFFDQEGQWEVLTDNEYAGMQFTIGTTDFRYRLRLYDPGDPCGVPPVEPRLIHTWLIRTRTHRLGARDRWFFQGTVNDEYDADTGRELLFVSGTQSPEGIVVFDRRVLEGWVFGNMGGDPGNPSRDVLDLELSDDGVVVAKLNTDPEFSNVPNGHTSGPTHQFLQLQRFPADPDPISISGRLQTYTPRTMKLPSTEGGPPDTWILAAPCGFLENGEQDVNAAGQHFVSYTNNPEWQTEPEYSDFNRLLVQFWDVNDPDVLEDSIQSDPYDMGVPAFELYVGGSDSANALYLNVQEYLGRTYLFVGDFGGRVEVLDVTDVLWDAAAPIELVETWVPAQSLTDHLPNNVWEVAVDRAQWSSGGTDFDEVYVYVGVERVGIEVLRFDPSCAPGERLEKVDLIQTPGNVRSMVIRDTGGDRSLILTDGEAGLRILEYNF